MKHHRFTKRGALGIISAALALILSLNACGSGSAQVIALPPGGKAPPTAPERAHMAPLIGKDAKPIAKSGWLELFLDDASKTVSIRGYSGKAQWSTLPQEARTGFAAADAHIIAGGKRLRLNTQDHAVAYGNATAKTLSEDGAVIGVQVEYLLTPNSATAKKAKLAPDDVAFTLRLRYTLRGGNFYVEAGWENTSGNPEAFVESIGLMERFGALQNPEKDDFLLLPDGGGALLYPARSTAAARSEAAETEAADLRFSVYGEDPANPVPQNTTTLHYRDEAGLPLGANVAAYGVRSGESAFAAVVEQGAALCSITAAQKAQGKGVPMSAVGPRFTITPTTLGSGDAADDTIYRAARSYGGEDHPRETIRLSYRFFQGTENVNFSTLAMACREQLINIRLLSSTKTVPDGSALPLNLTLLGTGPGGAGTRTLTSFEQALDILTRLKSKGADAINVRCEGAFTERWAPLGRLGGRRGFGALQEFCAAQGFSLFPDVRVFSGGEQAPALTGAPLWMLPPERGVLFPEHAAEPVSLRRMGSAGQAARTVINRLGRFDTAGISLGDLGGALYADYTENRHREQTAAQIGRLIPSFSAQRLVMMDTGYFHAVRSADMIVNLPLEPRVVMPGSRMEPRYEPVPFLPILLRGSMDYAGPSLNLAEDSTEAFLRSVAYGACPAYTWTADRGDERLDFEQHLENMMEPRTGVYIRARTALSDLRADRITGYRVVEPGVTETHFSSDAVIYVNFTAAPKQIESFTIPPYDFVRV